MHPHWYSTSPEVQHRLISLYLVSLTSTSPDGATSPTSPNTLTTFESELHYTRSPHDVAAVLRWGLRHLKIEGDSFGKESGDWTWYNTFAEAERAGSHPAVAFSKFLIPQLPTAHTELLLATLDIISSLSARCEANGSSGSKLSKFFGLWLLSSEPSTGCADWSAFYDRWDRAGRILEHLFLARIRFVPVVLSLPTTSDGHTHIVMTHIVYLVGSLILLSITLMITAPTHLRTICCHVHDSQHGNMTHCSCKWTRNIPVPRNPSHIHFDSLQTLFVPNLQANPQLLKMITYGTQSRRPLSLTMLRKALATPPPGNPFLSFLMSFLMILSASFLLYLWIYQTRTSLRPHILFDHPSLQTDHARSLFPRHHTLSRPTVAVHHHLATSL
jgi:hypothetical protein